MTYTFTVEELQEYTDLIKKIEYASFVYWRKEYTKNYIKKMITEAKAARKRLEKKYPGLKLNNYRSDIWLRED